MSLGPSFDFVIGLLVLFEDAVRCADSIFVSTLITFVTRSWTFKVTCRSQDLTAGESVKLDIDLKNVEGNGYKGLANLAVYLQGNDTVILLDKRVSITQSNICLSIL